MDDTLYESAKNKIEEKFAKAKSEYEADITALDRLWPLFQSCEKENQTADGIASDANFTVGASDLDRGEITKAIRAAVEELSGTEYTRMDVEAILRHDGVIPNKSTVAQNLKRLEECGIIRVIMRGEGRRPTTYLTVEDPLADL